MNERAKFDQPPAMGATDNRIIEMQNEKPKRRPVRTVLKYAGLLILAGGGVLAGSAMLTKVPGEEMLAGNLKRNSAVYVKMTDGTKIAVDVWLPPQMKAGERLPVLTMTTRYWRTQQVGWLQRALYGIGLGEEGFTTGKFLDFMNKRGFVVLQVDARGTGASGGNRLGEWAPDEVKDFGEVARWASIQPWSNGSVGAVGVSYEGNTAELYASTGEPSIKAVAPLYDDFDPTIHNSNPGGVFNTGFITVWGNGTAALDRNDICTLAETPGLMCIFTKWMVPGVKPVDADSSGKQLTDILRARKSNNVLNGLKGVEYRDDPFKDGGGTTLAEVSPFSKKQAFEKYQVPMMVWSSWMDAATTDGTLSRFLTFNTPQLVHIGAYSHGGGHDTDPTMPVDTPSAPVSEKQWATIADFFDTYLRGGAPAAPKRNITYFTMGARTWHQTAVWPPIGTTKQALYFGDNSTLAAAQTGAASDRYTVDFTAATGKPTRWATQMGGGDVIYPDRRDADKKLLSYTSAPFAAATTITGTPVVTTYLSTTATDGVVIAYLEDVAPDGRVTYITEGVLRLTNRKETDTNLPYVMLGVNRSFRRADALPVIPGQVMEVRVPLYATSIQIKPGHRIRIALAGAADGQFDRTPKTGPVAWTVYRDAKRPSGVDLPIAK
jgi:uncharacterized protein